MKGAADPVKSAEHRAISLKVAREAVVLLKNSNGTLPLDRQAIQSIAVVGSLANTVLPDFYGGTPPYTASILAAIKAKVGTDTKVNYFPDNKDGAAAEAAKSANVAIVVVGNHPTCNRTPLKLLQSLMTSTGPAAACPVPGEGMESSDRQSITLDQEDLVKEIYRANRKTIVVLVASAPYAIDWTQENVPAILHTSHNGQDEGTSIADVIFGDYNPAGRLVQTWVRSLEQLPPMMDYNIRHGRTYLYLKDSPLYPFGYGLSYTGFQYGNLRCNSETLSREGEIACMVDVTNTGTRDGDEVVQLYVRHPASKVERPLLELKGFERVPIGRGQMRTVTFSLKASALAYWDEGKKDWTVETEPVEIQVGASSADIKLTKTVHVSG